VHSGSKNARYQYIHLSPIRAGMVEDLKGINLGHLIGIVAGRLELDVDLILNSSRQKTVALARSIICCVAVDQLMFSGTFVASRLNLTLSAVSKLVSPGRLETKTREIAKELPGAK
jgi:hypothetical protein